MGLALAAVLCSASSSGLSKAQRLRILILTEWVCRFSTETCHSARVMLTTWANFACRSPGARLSLREPHHGTTGHGPKPERKEDKNLLVSFLHFVETEKLVPNSYGDAKIESGRQSEQRAAHKTYLDESAFFRMESICSSKHTVWRMKI